MVERIAEQLSERDDLRRAGPLHRRVGRGGEAASARPRLPALPAAGLRRDAPPPPARAGAGAAAGRAAGRVRRWAPWSAGVAAWRRSSVPLNAACPSRRRCGSSWSSRQPDVLLITPLIDIGSPQLDHFAAARALGIRTLLPVGSWDHLSSKALLRVLPERVLVWNQMQRQEAVELHGVPSDRVVVTGAQCYDQWFGRAAVTQPGGLLRPRRPGPRAGRSCSTRARRSSVARSASRSSWRPGSARSAPAADPRLKGIGILIRPHPARLDEWRAVDLSGQRNLVFWGAHPVDAEAKDDYFDSMYYSAGVVGINTSAFLEAAVVGKPVHTVLLPEVSRDNQEGTLHFRYLLNVNGGLLRAARSLEEHLTLLAGLAGAGGRGRRKGGPFRRTGSCGPYGRGEAATPRFVAAIEEAGTLPAPPRERRSARRLARRSSRCIRSRPCWRCTCARSRGASARGTGWSSSGSDSARWPLRRIKQFAIDHLGAAGKQRKSATAVGGSALTPKTGRQRDPAKTLAGTDLREARHTRELVTVLGRSDRPIIVGPWLSETGFELLYWIPFVAWAKAYGNFDPSRLVVVSRGGAAPWYRHITAELRGDLLVLHARRVPGPERGPDRRAGRPAEAPRDLVVRPRDHRPRGSASWASTGAEVLHPSLMYQLFDHYWYQRTPVTLVEAFTVVRAADGADRHRRPAAPARPLRRRQVLRQRGAAVDTRERPLRVVVPGRSGAAQRRRAAEHRAAVRRPLGLPQGAAGPRARHRPPDGPGPQPGGADRGDPERRRRSSAPTAGFSYLAPLCGVNTVAFYSHPNGFRVDHLEVAKRVFSALQVRHLHRAGPPGRGRAAARAGRHAAGADGQHAVSNPRAAVTNLASQAGAARRVAGPAGAEAVDRGRQGRLARRAGARSKSARDACVNAGQGRVPAGAAAAARRVAPPIADAGTAAVLPHRVVDRARARGAGHARPPAGGRALALRGGLRGAVLGAVPALAARRAFHVDPDRVVAVSRGGVAGWYEGVAGQYVEIWDHIDPAAFARRNAERGATKQLRGVGSRPRDPGRTWRGRSARRDFDVIHPGLMYRLFTLYWSGQRAMGFLDAHTRFTRMEAPQHHRPGAAAARVRGGEVLRGAVAARHAADPRRSCGRCWRRSRARFRWCCSTPGSCSRTTTPTTRSTPARRSSAPGRG